MSVSWCDTKWRCKQINKKKTFLRQKFLWTVWEMSVGRKNVSITHRGSFVLLSFYGESLVVSAFQVILHVSILWFKVFIRYFLSVRNFPNKFSSSSCGSSLGVEFHNFFADLRMSLGLLEYFDLLSSVYNSNIVWFFIFSLSSTLKEILGHFWPSSF